MSAGLVILDGTDVAGKTTLANALLDKYGGYYFHCGYKFKDRMHLYHLAALRWAIKRLDKPGLVVIDRWWPSEMVYGNVYREGRRVPNEGFRILHRLALRHGAIYVICYRDSREKYVEEFARSKCERPELWPADDRVPQIHDGFQYLYESIQGQQGRWLRYNLDVSLRNPHYFSAMVDTIGGCAKAYNYHRSVIEDDLPHSVGSPAAEYLLVGERINRQYRSLDYPWIAFQGASYNMARSLGELNVPEHKLLWTNAVLPGGDENEPLAKMLKKLAPFRKVIAMGAEATKFCQDHGRCTYAMPHPAYLTRFNGPESLTRTLGQIFT